MPIRRNADGTLTDGIFDNRSNNNRYVYKDGNVTHTVSKLWIETKDVNQLNRLEPRFRLQWGSYPDVPSTK